MTLRPGEVHRRRGEKGASAVEFALVLPVLIALLLGIIEFGFAFNNQISLNQAVREGARVDAVSPGDGADVTASSFLGATAETDDLDITTEAFDIEEDSRSSLGDGTDCGTDGADSVQISATYDGGFLLFPIDGIANVDGITLTGVAEMRCEG